MSNNEERFKPGDRIMADGHVYEVVRILGEGGMGVVYEVIERSVGAVLALKVLHLEHAREGGSILHRFLREARIPARLLFAGRPHTSFVRVHYLGTLKGEYQPYYAMDLLHGGTLKAYLKAVHTVAKREHRAPGMPSDQALNIVLAICFGVAALHERGVIHRDLKPDNIILHRDEEGRLVLKIIDYGIAHLETEGEYAAPAGTSTYAAAEQYLAGRVLTPKVDVFAIGVMMFEMLTGSRPFESYGKNWEGAVARADAEPPSLTDFRADIPPAIAKIVALTLSPRPEVRPDVTSLYTTLQDIVNALPPMDPHEAVTLEVPDREPSGPVKKMELGDLGDPTNPEGIDFEVLMMRAEADRLRHLVGNPNDTEPGGMLPFAPTQPKSNPVHGDVEIREAAPALAVSLPAPEAPPLSRDVTRPPTERPAPPSTPDDIRYLDSVDPKREPPAAFDALPDIQKLREALKRNAATPAAPSPRPARATPAGGKGRTVPMAAPYRTPPRPSGADMQWTPVPEKASVAERAGGAAAQAPSPPRRRRGEVTPTKRIAAFVVMLVVVVGSGLATTMYAMRPERRPATRTDPRP